MLRADAPGTYEVIISFTGYKFYRKQINLSKAGSAVVTASMETTGRDLGAVTVVAKKDAKWKKRLKEFKFIFLGGTRNSPSCQILNEDMLYFEEDEETGVFEAYASEPLVIENQALGYRLTYSLEDFRIFYKENYPQFHGYPSFENMAEKGDVKKKWLNSRDKAYKGSLQHFSENSTRVLRIRLVFASGERKWSMKPYKLNSRNLMSTYWSIGVRTALERSWLSSIICT